MEKRIYQLLEDLKKYCQIMRVRSQANNIVGEAKGNVIYASHYLIFQRVAKAFIEAYFEDKQEVCLEDEFGSDDKDEKTLLANGFVLVKSEEYGDYFKLFIMDNPIPIDDVKDSSATITLKVLSTYGIVKIHFHEQGSYQNCLYFKFFAKEVMR